MSDDFWRRYSADQYRRQLFAESAKLKAEEIQRRVFYSFHYENECRIASQIRNIGALPSERKPVYDNGWEAVPKNETAIKRWISQQLDGRTCTIVLIGIQTANRYWVLYEIAESWSRGMGVFGIYTHNLNDPNGSIVHPRWKGANPFDLISTGGTFSPRLSSIVEIYDPPGAPGNSDAYKWIAGNLNAMVEKAISTREVQNPFYPL